MMNSFVFSMFWTGYGVLINNHNILCFDAGDFLFG
ncbi:hypothetical protein ACJIZ3_019860 [Penstemon smallii]|uniref:AtpF n=1 Tax=Penstemon smallii TaxID=265156 RepID=A0ABD3T3N2_9LAMI